MIQARAPAKVLVCGEHAVLYGSSAIAMAVQRFATTQIVDQASSHIVVSLHDLRTTLQVTLSTLRKIKQRIADLYQRFLAGSVGIHEVIASPGLLFQYAVMAFLDECEIAVLHGCSIHVSSTIPVGCGMGSSAATVVSLIRAMMHHFHVEKAADWIETFIRHVENLQHGRASGVDTYISLHGGCVCFHADQAPRSLAMPTIPMWIVVTGKPVSSTGECVCFVRDHFGSARIWSDFSAITQAMEEALLNNNVSDTKRLFRENELLLETIGVVPNTVKSFISCVYAQGGAAKVSGAGAVQGETGGIVLAIMDESIHELCARFGYECFPLQGECGGAYSYCC